MSQTSYGKILEQTLFPALHAGAIAVTGTSRLQRRLRFRYGEWRRKAQETVWQRPVIVSFEQWLKELWEQSMIRGGEAGRCALLPPHGSLMLWEQALASDTVEGFDLEQSAALARRSWKLALEYGLKIEDLRRAADGEDEKRFVRWATRFEELRAAGNWLEEAALPGVLVQDIQSKAVDVSGPVYLIGMDGQLPGPQARLLELLRGRGVETPPAPQPPHAATIRQVAYETAGEELEAAARWAGRGMCGIVLLDFRERAGATRRALLNRLQPGWQMHGFPVDAPVNSAEALPLSSFGPVEAALDVLCLLQRTLDMETVSRVLRGSYIGGSQGEAGARARLDCDLKETVVGTQISRMQLLTRTTAMAPGLAELLQTGWRAFRQAGGKGKRNSHRTWCAAFAAFLNTLGWPGRRTLSSAEQQAVNAWSNVMGSFSACDSVSSRPVPLKQALSRLEVMARERRFQPQGPDQAVELIPVSEAAGLNFSRLWVAGASAGQWPRASRPEPLLPLRLQRRLNMPLASPQASLEQARQQTEALMHSADELVFSWTQVAEGGVITTCSPLVADVPLATDREVMGGGEELSYPEILRCSAQLQEVGDDAPPPAAQGEEIGGGTQLMDAQLASPFHAFAIYRLHARANPVSWDGLSALHRGQMVHRLLRDLYSEYSSRDDLLAALDEDHEEPAEGLKKQLAEWAGVIPKHEPLGLRPLVSGLLLLERERAVALALEWAMTNAEHGDFVVETVEEFSELTLGPAQTSAEEPSTTGQAHIDAIALTLRLDRVDRTGPDQLRVVLDYKTGQKFWLPALHPQRLSSSQLPAYALATPGAAAIAYVHLSDEPPKVIGVYDDEADIPYADTLRLSPVGNAWKPWDENWAGTLAAWRDALNQAARRILAGDARVEIFSKARGRFSQYDILSRRHELERRAL